MFFVETLSETECKKMIFIELACKMDQKMKI